jgi:polar amino acid transport system substrate-binding protein
MKALILLLMASFLAVPAARAQTIHAVTETTSYSFLKEGKVVGPATEVVELSLNRAGLSDYQINLYPWARSYDMALKEPNVLIYAIARTPAREQQFKWVGELMKVQFHFYKLKDHKAIVRNLQDAKTLAIGVLRDDIRHQYLKEKGFTRLVVSAQQEDLFRKLLSGQVDIIPLPEDDAASLCKEMQVNCESLEKIYTLDELSTGLYMAYSLATPDALVERTRSAFEKIRAAGTVKSIMEKKR